MYSKLDHVAFHLMRKLFQEHTASWQRGMPSLTKPQYSVMRAVSDQPGIEQVELMDASVTTKATLAEMLGRMEKRGLIRREQSETDKRRRFVFLTPEGEELLNEATPIANNVDDVYLERLTKEEHDEFIRLLKKLVTPKHRA
ncbi:MULTISPECIES: MarR family winged helix-turn-helix transcriptional regulator [Vibrio]|uniref:MarR family transcriptional regulator n=2 Tax=Vibrio TaxID=662 RepID=A0A7X4LME1_9VIBR|nr:MULTISPECIES: MarR family transcriptional regulator [Vibrio]MBF9000973.1 MarR family transcriptional regulator [Vibrio nitrifigilis]MZI94436.1 MarR family transcriptional regulator [Vibrio eleionomae]